MELSNLRSHFLMSRTRDAHSTLSGNAVIFSSPTGRYPLGPDHKSRMRVRLIVGCCRMIIRIPHVLRARHFVEHGAGKPAWPGDLQGETLDHRGQHQQVLVITVPVELW